MDPSNMKKETMMNLEILIALLKNLDSGSIDQVIEALEVELLDRESAEVFKEAHDEMLARQYA